MIDQKVRDAAKEAANIIKQDNGMHILGGIGDVFLVGYAPETRRKVGELEYLDLNDPEHVAELRKERVNARFFLYGVSPNQIEQLLLRAEYTKEEIDYARKEFEQLSYQKISFE